MTAVSDRAKAFIAWTKVQGAQWDLGGVYDNGKFAHYIDSDTDTAWLGFCAGWDAAKTRTDAALEIIQDLMSGYDWVGTGDTASGELERKEFEDRITAL